MLCPRRLLALTTAITGAAVAWGPAAMADAGSSTPRWRVVATTPGFLQAVIAPAARSAWALGWNGSSWSRAKLPAGVRHSGVAGAAASSPGDVWVIGAGSHLGNGVGTWHLSASAASADDIWATTNFTCGQQEVAHWNGHRWIQNATFGQALPKLSGVIGAGSVVTAHSATDVWGATSFDRLVGGHQITAVVLHWNGHGWWSTGHVPTPAVFANVPGTRSMLAVGELFIKGRADSGVVLSSGPLHR
jgi:hypothetical protein